MLKVIPEVVNYKIERIFNCPKTLPINITLSITNKCNSRCRTCFIWRLYKEKQELSYSELTTDEYNKIFLSLGKQVAWATISGGEPFLRKDLPEICSNLYTHCTPNIITIATNGLLPDIIQENMRRILQGCNKAVVIVNLSLDGTAEEHDAIRRISGNSDRTLDTYNRLKGLKSSFSNLRVGIHSVISRFNIQSFPKLYNYVRDLDPDSYITEMAENRVELFNMDEKITPEPKDYQIFVKHLLNNMHEDSHKNTDGISRLIQAFRILYYEMAAKELWEKRQIIPCYAGYASAQINYNGDVWPCSVLGFEKTIGNLREYNYDFKALWSSKQAEETKKWIKSQSCHCSLANAHYTSILCNFPLMLKVLRQYLCNIL